MKNQIRQLFHNIIAREEKADEIVNKNYLNLKAETGAAILEDSGCGTVKEKEMGTACGRVGAPVDRKSFERTVNGMMDEEPETGCMLVSDIDRFKEVNDIYGYETGNAVLRNVVTVFREQFEECVCIGSPGGDIFVLWLQGMSPKDTDYIRRQVGVANDRLLHPRGDLPPVTLSVGAAFRESEDTCRSLGKKAGEALYRVKESGRCGCEIYRKHKEESK